MRSITSVALVVRDYDEAIAFFTSALRFTLVEDTPLGHGKRWVVVAPPSTTGASLLLAKAATPEQQAHIGNQTGGRVFLFLHTDDFWGDYNHMQAHGVQFIEQPRHEPYGTVVVFLDLYGNKWDMISTQPPRQGWDTQFAAAAKNADDPPPDQFPATQWEQDEWTW